MLNGNSFVKNVEFLNPALENQEIRAAVSKYQPQRNVFNSKTSRFDIAEEINDYTIVNIVIADNVCNSNITP